jgi:hypothetical protein
VPKHILDANLQVFMRSQHIMSNVTEKADYIDRLLFPIYTSGNKTHARIDVDLYKGLLGKDLFQFGASLFSLTDEVLEEAGLQPETDEVEVKVKTQINSPGYLKLIHTDPLIIIAAIGLVGWMVIGNKIKFNYDGKKVNFEISSDGSLLSQFSNFLDAREDRKLRSAVRKNLGKLEASEEKMNISASLEILKLLQSGSQSKNKQLGNDKPNEEGTAEEEAEMPD